MGGSSKFSGGGEFFWGVLQIFGGGLFWGGSSPEYGQRSAGMHPTGMHSCLVEVFVSFIAVANPVWSVFKTFCIQLDLDN